MQQPKIFKLIGPSAIISLSQLFGTSLWFSANSAADGLTQAWDATASDIGWLTSAVQAGFILGTLAASLGGLADRYPASFIFVVSAIVGASANACFAWLASGLGSGLAFRFLVGLSLAGIYPIGMKLIVSWEPERTGRALALLVAMLTMGTASPHLLQALGDVQQWQWIVTTSSLLALVAAVLVLALGDGPHLPIRPVKAGSIAGHGTAILAAFRIPQFRAAAVGYFGHMWELYAFWAITPLLVTATGLAEQYPRLGVPGLSFMIIASGAIGCLVGGWFAQRIGNAPVALAALVFSGTSAVVFAIFCQDLSGSVLLGLLLIWGATVVADSPQFSTLSIKACPSHMVGGVLAVQNAIGFTLTVVSIGMTSYFFESMGPQTVWLLVPGPVVGFIGYRLTESRTSRSRRKVN